MAASLERIVEAYLEDTEFHDDRDEIDRARYGVLPTFRRVVDKFIAKTSSVQELKDQISSAIPAKDPWKIRSATFTQELSKFAKNHCVTPTGAKDTGPETVLRELLTGLKAENLGARIQQFNQFLQQERLRFQKEKVLKEKQRHLGNVAPGNSALIVSFFAHWLDWSARTIYYTDLLGGIKILVDAALLPQTVGLRMKQDKVEVNTEADHLAVTQILDNLAAAYPRLQSIHTYWAESFLLWIKQHPEALEIEDDVPANSIYLFPAAPLAPIANDRLNDRITALRRHILIDEKLVRRIYHALLAGHVILTGPPGTGKTALARLLPEILWGVEEQDENKEPTAYATNLITATEGWSVRTLIGGLTPRSVNGQVAYTIQYGHLTETIRQNWTGEPDNPQTWGGQRNSINAPSALNGKASQNFRGLWLVIDEFNRAPIDAALGEAFTALSGGGNATLRIPTDNGGSALLPIPDDFRIIGTLNSFDRNYLNQISEALKRRFSFIEVLPPTRAIREDEQRMVAVSALSSLENLEIDTDLDIVTERVKFIYWPEFDRMALDLYSSDENEWELGGFKSVWRLAWSVFEIIRIYRQLGTAQAISLLRTMLITGLLQDYTTEDQWRDALDEAFCDTIADQLQVLLQDELDALSWYAKGKRGAEFIKLYNDQFRKLVPRRRQAQLEALARVIGENGQPLLSDEDIERVAGNTNERVSDDVLTEIFHLNEPAVSLPQFARRLRMFKAEQQL